VIREVRVSARSGRFPPVKGIVAHRHLTDERIRRELARIDRVEVELASHRSFSVQSPPATSLRQTGFSTPCVRTTRRIQENAAALPILRNPIVFMPPTFQRVERICGIHDRERLERRRAAAR
jgi:hypothetical protein